MLKTRLTDLLGLRYPVISAPMVRMSGGKLAGAVSAAGGLGTFGAASNSPAAADPVYIREQIGLIRSVTDQPFGVGFITQALDVVPRNFEIVLEEKVPVVLFSFADPTPWVRRAKEAGAKVVCQVQSIEAARVAVAAGADVLAAQGNESGGHTGRQQLLPFLVYLVEEFPEIPVIAAGGIANGRSLAAVLAAGGEGAWVGTAFVATDENAEVPEIHKSQIVSLTGDDTVLTEVFDIVHTRARNTQAWPPGIAARVHNNAFIQSWHGREDELRAHVDEVVPIYAAAMKSGDRDIFPLLFGYSADFIHAVRPAADVLHDLCETAEQCLRGRAKDVLQ
jgi:nitronate monooxygenase